ncbi:MAG: hypothetical protein WC343_03765 [Bacilli bacterium]|jgi:hypothetical protein
MAQNEKRVCLTMPTELQARVRKYLFETGKGTMDRSREICSMVDEKLKEKGY